MCILNLIVMNLDNEFNYFHVGMMGCDAYNEFDCGKFR